ncbi:MAG: serine protease [Anaerolineae bacterium]|nr:serine protease [Anaerolineae bacterium]
MIWDENLTNLNYVLAGLYPLQDQSITVARRANVPITHIRFQPAAIDNWYAILDEANKRDIVIDVIRAAQRDFPEDPFLELAAKEQLTSVRGPIIGKDLSWDNQQPTEVLEKIMGQQSTLLPISFLEVGLKRARSVARVKLANGGLGSGFLTNNNIFVTNNHVIHDKNEAETTIIQFNYQKTAVGLNLEPVEFHLDPNGVFVTSIDDDWTLVQILGDANTEWGAIDLNPVQVNETDRVNIIQHPGGGSKQIALYHNVVAYVDDKRIQYLTDTLPGSSGSPVFDSKWQLVALHHSGGWISEPGTKKQVFRNEGINVNCILII